MRPCRPAVELGRGAANCNCVLMGCFECNGVARLQIKIMSKEILDHENKKEAVKKKNPLLVVINILVALLILYYLSRRLFAYIKYGELADGLWAMVIILPLAFLFIEVSRLWKLK